MASAQHSSLPPDVQENIVHNIQKIFPNYVDKKVIKAVLNRESWDLEKALDFLKNGLNSYNENPNNTKKKDGKPKKAYKGAPQSHQNKSNINTSGPNKTPALIKNFKKNTRSKKTKQANKENPSEDLVGDRNLLNGNKNSSQSGKSDTSKFIAKESVEKAQSNDNRLAKRKRMIQHYEIIKQFGEPLNRISAYINGGIRVMILLRGCSGSGKTTYASQILKKHGTKNLQSHIFSTDNFFLSKEGKYSFNYDQLQIAHEWNQKLVRLAASEGRSPIFVDNTNTRLWEMREYAVMAVEFGYVLETLEPPTPWFFNEEMLVRKTLHGVSRDSIKKMLDRYEANISGEDVLRVLKLSYNSLAPPQGVMAGLDVPMSKKQIQFLNEKPIIESNNSNKSIQPVKSAPRKSLVKPPDVPAQFRKPRQMENTDVPVYNRQSNKPIENPYYHQPMPVNNSFRFDTQGGNVPLGPNNFMGHNNYGVQNQQTRLYPDLYSEMDRNRMSAAVPNLFSSQYNPRFVQSNYNHPKSICDLSLPGSSSQQFIEKFPNINSYPDNVRNSVPPYVEDLIDLTIPTKVEQLNEYSELSNDMSSSVSLLEGLKIDEVPLEQMETDSNDEDEDSNLNDTDESDYETDAGSTIAFQSDQQTSLEYVLIIEDNKIVFQKDHKELDNIDSLEDFKKTKSNSVTSFPNNFEEFLMHYMENSKSGVNEEDGNCGLLNKVSNCDSICNLTTVGNKSDDDLPDMCDDDTTNKKVVLPTSPDYQNLAESTYELPICVPKEQRIKLPENLKKVSSMSVTSNTNYLDFELLRKVNNGLEVENTKILSGKPCFVSEICRTSCEPVTVLMLEKGVMTIDIETSQVVVRDCGIDRLALMFPNVCRENLEELFDNCQKDIDWTAGILLDSGQEMSELYSSLEPIECSSQEEKIVKTPQPSNINESEILQNEIKKLKKKKNEFDGNRYKEIQEKIESNFVLGENHYSEKMKKHIERKHKIQIGPSPEATSVSVDESVLAEEMNSDNLEGNEEDVVFMLDSDFIFQLQSRFGGLLRPNMIGEKTVISLPLNLARQLHNCVMDSILQQIEEEDLFETDSSIITKDEELARNLQEEELKARGIPSLLEIMDGEVALRKAQGPKDNSNGKSMAGRLSKQLLIERFPLMDPTTLALILEDTNHSLHEATCLLSSAGHFQADSKPQTEQNERVELEKNALSREEAIKQADAYGDIASKLYELRKDCLKKSQDAYREGNHSVALYYSDMAKWYMERIEKSNSLAAKAILSGYEGWTTLDLHFLQVSEALNVLDLFVDEVIRGLQESKNKRAVVYIITGRGLHSAGRRPRLKPAVQSRLYKRDLRYVEQNPGMLRVIIPRTALTSYNRDIAEIATCA